MKSNFGDVKMLKTNFGDTKTEFNRYAVIPPTLLKLIKDLLPNTDFGGYHHMGGTRMSSSSQNGVVDKNLKIFGKKNLYILGSSVFPGGGHANPTYTITLL